MNRLMVVVVLALLIGGCQPGDWGEAEPKLVPRGQPASFENVMPILLESDEVWAYLLRRGSSEVNIASRRIGTVEAIAHGPRLTKEQQQVVVNAMRTASEEKCGVGKPCTIEPYVGIRFVRGDRVVDVSMCLDCYAWLVDANYARVSGLDVNFDCVAEELILLAKDLFPRDPSIRNLKYRPVGVSS